MLYNCVPTLDHLLKVSNEKSHLEIGAAPVPAIVSTSGGLSALSPVLSAGDPQT